MTYSKMLAVPNLTALNKVCCQAKEAGNRKHFYTREGREVWFPESEKQEQNRSPPFALNLRSKREYTNLAKPLPPPVMRFGSFAPDIANIQPVKARLTCCFTLSAANISRMQWQSASYKAPELLGLQFERLKACQLAAFFFFRATGLNQLIKITQGENGAQLVDARELHQFLESKSRFDDWFRNRVMKYDFTENEDFVIIPKSLGKRGRPAKEYALTLDMAKELAILENNGKGRKARRYFIAVEKAYKRRCL
ncbi:MAG: antA/AntB antirepressor family protein [Cyclobacteriaceae bacterium]